MRLRHKPWAKELIDQYPNWAISEPKLHRGQWHQIFPKKQPLYIEIGSGKGQFIIEMAQRYPDINFIAIELQTSVLADILLKQIEVKCSNLKMINGNARFLTEYFSAHEVDRIYLNFSDPWPKQRHSKRRLTSANFLKLYQEVLHPEGEIHFKTDNQGLFEFSLVSMSEFGMILKQVWLDLHHSDFQDNIMTEFEAKFSQKGQRIYRLEAQFQKNNRSTL